MVRGATVRCEGARVRSGGPGPGSGVWSAPFSVFAATAKIALEACDGADCATREQVEHGPLFLVDVIAISCVADVIPALVQRPTGDIEKSSELRVSSSAEPF